MKKNGDEGSIHDRLHVLKFLKKSGLLDLYDTQARFERKARVIDAENCGKDALILSLGIAIVEKLAKPLGVSAGELTD